MRDGKKAPAGRTGLVDQRLLRTIAFSATGLFVLALAGVFWFGRPLLLPLFAAFLLMLALAPVVSWLQRRGIPGQFSALLGSTVFVVILQIGLIGFVVPMAHWIERAPQIGQKLEQRLASLRGPVKAIQDAGKQVKKATEGKKDPDVVKVEIKRPGFFEELLSTTPTILFQLGLTVVLLFFLLATREGFREQLIVSPDKWGTKIRVARIIREVEQNCSRYLFTVSLINLGLGAAIGIALYLLGMPEPLLWGMQSALLNFIPFIGPIVSVGVVGLVSLAVMDPLWLAFTVPGVVLALHLLESFLVRPNVMSLRFKLNPFAAFLHLVFWGWIWGPVGAFMSVPMLIVLKVLFDQIQVLEPVGALIGRDPQAEAVAEAAEEVAEKDEEAEDEAEDETEPGSTPKPALEGGGATRA